MDKCPITVSPCFSRAGHSIAHPKQSKLSLCRLPHQAGALGSGLNLTSNLQDLNAGVIVTVRGPRNLPQATLHVPRQPATECVPACARHSTLHIVFDLIVVPPARYLSCCLLAHNGSMEHALFAINAPEILLGLLGVAGGGATLSVQLRAPHLGQRLSPTHLPEQCLPKRSL